MSLVGEAMSAVGLTAGVAAYVIVMALTASVAMSAAGVAESAMSLTTGVAVSAIIICVATGMSTTCGNICHYHGTGQCIASAVA